MNVFDVLVLPVSGGAFVCQIAAIQHLTQIGYKPSITLASSGGNVCAYIASASQWKWGPMELFAREIKPEMFAQQWSEILLISYLIGFFNGNIYSQGTGIEDLLHKRFSLLDVKTDEIWTGTYNTDKKRTHLFCNRSQNESVLFSENITNDPVYNEITKSMPHTFCNGNIQQIAKACFASASVPGLIPGQFIDGDIYVDGGISSPSPLTILQNPIINHCQSLSKALHISYISPVNYDNKSRNSNFNFIDTILGVKDDILKSNMVIERNIAYNMFTSYVKNKTSKNYAKHSNFECNNKNLTIVKKIKQYSHASLLEIYPSNNNTSISITNFTSNDIIDNIHKSYDICMVNFWWVSNPKIEHLKFDNDISISNVKI